MMKLLLISAVALSTFTVNAGDTMVNVEHGDGHVDNTNRVGGGGLAEFARLHHDKIHTGKGLSNLHAADEFGDFHREDLGLGQHENMLHETEFAHLPSHDLEGHHGDEHHNHH
uniref:Uncharacterized protein n=1 Tax=Spongospora subterranea TaxID=70186 RepID=A0A0H5QQ93_9EUKA|eukprot:CRZ04203.1 hypothetical protein [Spongospora subterranea]